jgi:uncharacterized protein
MQCVQTTGWQCGAVTDAPQDAVPAAANPALRDPAHQVSTKAPMLWMVGAVLRSLLLLAALVAVELFDWFDVPVWVWPAYAVLAIAYVIAMPRVRYRIHRWESTDTAVYTQTGWWARERRIAPMSRIQTVDYVEGAVARLFGLASVTVTTASAAGALEIAGLDRARARELVDELTLKADAAEGDAT